MCITISTRRFVENGIEKLEFESSRNVYGKYASAFGQLGISYTDAQYREFAIIETMRYLGIPRTSICGQGVDPAIAIAAAAAAAAERAKALAEIERRAAEENARDAEELARKEAEAKKPGSALLPSFITDDIKITETISIKPVYVVIVGLTILIIYFISRK